MGMNDAKEICFYEVNTACDCTRCRLWAATHTNTTPIDTMSIINSIQLEIPAPKGRKGGSK